MAKQLLMGNEAIALGALAAGVQVVSGYPGTPSTEVLETVAKYKNGQYIEWSVNEKVAMEVAAGAAYAGARSLVTMKQVGLNVASDPLMSLAYIGVKGGMVVLTADDPGPISSQTEQDTRHFAQFAHLPVFDPATPEEAYELIQQAFLYSEKYQTPVIFRPTTQVCHARAVVNIMPNPKVSLAAEFISDSKWVIFPRLSYQNHLRIAANEEKMAADFSEGDFNRISGKGTKGIICSGISIPLVKEVLAELNIDAKVLAIATPQPFPSDLAKKFMAGLSEVLAVEELDPILENSLLKICGQYNLQTKIYGKLTGITPVAGGYNFAVVQAAIAKFYGIALPEAVREAVPQLPVRPPVLCAGCPHRASFYSVKLAMRRAKQQAVFTGDIGCYTLGNAKPLNMVDTCLCMGGGITIAQGIGRAGTKAKQIAFIGDSTFFHTGIPGIINAVYNETDITVIILDNSTTAMTGHQPHPGTGRTMMGNVTEKIDIGKVLAGCNVKFIEHANPFDLAAAVSVVQSAVAFKGVSAVIFEAPCIALFKPTKLHKVVTEKCIGCQKCIKEIGCPAIFLVDGKAKIDKNLCYGCNLCTQLCAVKAIIEEEGENK